MNFGTDEVDSRYSRFFAYISLFACGMLGLVISDNLVTLLIFWEIMGLCSYLLIGFWFDKSYPDPKRITPKEAGLKAFLTTRIGDVIMLAGMLLLYSQTGTLTFREIFSRGDAAPPGHTPTPLASVPWATLIALLIFGGAVGKSAQFPLHVWLPDAMEGPTPVSALIHAATMVSAGVYLVARTFPLFVAVRGRHAVGGGGLYRRLHGPFCQHHRRGPERHQTGAGLFDHQPARLHDRRPGHRRLRGRRVPPDHPRLFQGAAVPGLRLGDPRRGAWPPPRPPRRPRRTARSEFDANDMMNMGGLLRRMPGTGWTFIIGALALTGIFPWAGFWSKDEILADAWHTFLHGGHFGVSAGWGFFVWLLLTLAAFLTAFYTGRQIFLTFAGKPRTEAAAHAPESVPQHDLAADHPGRLCHLPGPGRHALGQPVLTP